MRRDLTTARGFSEPSRAEPSRAEPVALEAAVRPEPFYEDDGVTIYNADCNEVLPMLAPADVALVLADPPWGKNERTKRVTAGRVGKGGPTMHPGAYKAREWEPIHGDDRPFDPAPLLRFPRAVIWGAPYFADKLPPSPSYLIWDKRDGTTPDDNADCEIAWSNLGGPARIFRHLWRGLCRASETGVDHLHPTQKPVALASWILQRWTKPGDLVVDPYMGAGYVAVACQQLGRRFIGCDLVKHYCEVTVRRLAQRSLSLGGAA